MTCFWWQLTHNTTVHIIRLSLNKSCLRMDAKKIPTLAGCHLATHPKSGSRGSRGSQSVGIIRAMIVTYCIPDTTVTVKPQVYIYIYIYMYIYIYIYIYIWSRLRAQIRRKKGRQTGNETGRMKTIRMLNVLSPPLLLPSLYTEKRI